MADVSTKSVLEQTRRDPRARVCRDRRMTLTKEASEIRSEVEALRKGRGRKYSKAMRERVLLWLERAEESGMRSASLYSWIDCSDLSPASRCHRQGGTSWGVLQARAVTGAGLWTAHGLRSCAVAPTTSLGFAATDLCEGGSRGDSKNGCSGWRSRERRNRG